jgi:uncharacterized protein (TIGR00730 family)
MGLARICVYCGSSDKVAPKYLDAANAMGLCLAQKGIGLVYGGGSTGLMGAVANAVLAGGGEAIGVIPEFFDTPELAHRQLTELVRVGDMHQRKAKMAQLAEGFIALPGGFGTFEELFEIITWAQIGLHANPIGVLNIDGYFDPLIDLINHAQSQGFIYVEHKHLIAFETEPEALLGAMSRYQPPPNLERWVDRRKDKT